MSDFSECRGGSSVDGWCRACAGSSDRSARYVICGHANIYGSDNGSGGASGSGGSGSGSGSGGRRDSGRGSGNGSGRGSVPLLSFFSFTTFDLP
jgi:hypothetical protein